MSKTFKIVGSKYITTDNIMYKTGTSRQTLTSIIDKILTKQNYAWSSICTSYGTRATGQNFNAWQEYEWIQNRQKWKTGDGFTFGNDGVKIRVNKDMHILAFGRCAVGTGGAIGEIDFNLKKNTELLVQAFGGVAGGHVHSPGTLVWIGDVKKDDLIWMSIGFSVTTQYNIYGDDNKTQMILMEIPY